MQVNQNKRDNRKHLGGKPVKPGGKVLFSRPPNSPLLFCSIKKFTHRPGPRNTKSIIQRSTTIYCIERRSLLNAIIDSQWHSREVLKENKHILSSRHNRHCYLITTVMSQEDADLSLHDSKPIAHWYNTFTSWILRLWEALNDLLRLTEALILIRLGLEYDGPKWIQKENIVDLLKMIQLTEWTPQLDICDSQALQQVCNFFDLKAEVFARARS